MIHAQAGGALHMQRRTSCRLQVLLLPSRSQYPCLPLLRPTKKYTHSQTTHSPNALHFSHLSASKFYRTQTPLNGGFPSDCSNNMRAVTMTRHSASYTASQRQHSDTLRHEGEGHTPHHNVLFVYAPVPHQVKHTEIPEVNSISVVVPNFIEINAGCDRDHSP